MNIDIRTLSILLGITNVLQVIAIFLQYLMNKTYRGIGGWVLGFTSIAMGFVLLILRDIISIELISIISANALLVLGEIFIYIGSMRFLDKKENRGIVISIFAVFILSFFYFTYVNNNIAVRTVIVSATLATISFLTAQGLLVNKTRSITASANFIAAVFLAHGCFFAFRAAVTLTVAPVASVFTPTLMQTAVFLVSLIAGIILTFCFIIMVNQRLSEESREAKEHFELIFNTSPDASLITRLHDGIIVNINEGFTALTGFTRDETIGKSSLDINIWKNPDDRHKFVNELGEKGFCKNFETVFQWKDGNQIIGMMSAKIITLQGIPNIISVMRDITERKRVEKELRKSEALLREAQTAAHIGHWELDTSIMRPRWSEEIFHIFGLDPEKGEPSFAMHQEITHPDDWDILNNAVTTSIAEGTPFDIEFRVLRPDKTIRWMHAIGYPKRDSEGRMESVFGTAQDITERKQAEEEKRRLEERSRKVVEDIFRFIPEGVLVFSRKMELLRQNQAFRELVSGYAKRLGFAEDELENLIIDKIKAGMGDKKIKEIRISRKHETWK